MKVKAKYGQCAEITTVPAVIKQMILCGIIALISLTIADFIFGPEVLGGFLASLTVSGVIMVVFQAHVEEISDNVKRFFEKGVEINGKLEYKGSEVHKAL